MCEYSTASTNNYWSPAKSEVLLVPQTPEHDGRSSKESEWLKRPHSTSCLELLVASPVISQQEKPTPRSKSFSKNMLQSQFNTLRRSEKKQGRPSALKTATCCSREEGGWLLPEPPSAPSAAILGIELLLFNAALLDATASTEDDDSVSTRTSVDSIQYHKRNLSRTSYKTT